MNRTLETVERLLAILFKSSIKELMIDGISKDYGRSPTTLLEIFEEFARGGRINFYPSDSKGRCHEEAIFMSLSKKPKHAQKLRRKEFVPLDQMLEHVVQHMQGACQKTTKTAVIVTDVINTDVFAPWVNNLKNIQDVDGKSIYILYVKPDGNYEIINHLVDLSPF